MAVGGPFYDTAAGGDNERLVPAEGIGQCLLLEIPEGFFAALGEDHPDRPADAVGHHDVQVGVATAEAGRHG